METKVDTLIDIAGKSGRYQVLLNFILNFSSLLMYVLILLFPYFEVRPQVDYQTQDGNFIRNVKLTYEICEKATSITILSKTEWSWLTILHLECDKLRTSFLNFSFYIGLFIGSLSLKYLCNLIGRRVTFLTFVVLVNIARLCYNFPLNFYAMIVLNFVSAISQVLALYSCSLICMESTDYKTRTLVQCMQSILITLSQFFVIFYLKMTKDWLNCLNLVSAFQLVILVISYFCVYESPLFYLNKKKFNLFLETLHKISKVNKTNVAFSSLVLQNYEQVKCNYSDHTDEETLFIKEPTFYIEKQKECYEIIKELYLESKKEKKEELNLIFGELFSNTTVLLHFIMLSYLWIFRVVLFTGANLMIKSLEGNIYTTGSIFCMLEVIQIILLYFAMNSKIFGRVRTLFILVLINTIATCVGMFLDFNSLGFTIVIFCARMISISLVTVTVVYTMELYPTNARAAGLSLNSGVSRVFMMLVPFLVEYIGNNIIYVLFGMSVIALIPYFFLPETFESSIAK